MDAPFEQTPDHMRQPTLFIFSGLPGTGKSTLALRLAGHTRSAYLRIDTIEQGIRDLFDVSIQYEGYRLAHRIAAENLAGGISVVADSCNPLNLTRDDWRTAAGESGAAFIDIEIICSDESEHRRRVETRENTVRNLKGPTWREVREREYHEWSEHRIIIDTAGKSPERSFRELIREIRLRGI